MDKGLKALVAVTCLVVIVVAAGLHLDARKEAARVEAQADQLQRAKTAAHNRQCLRYLKDWDAGNRTAIIAEFRTYSEAMMLSCRIVTEMDR